MFKAECIRFHYPHVFANNMQQLFVFSLVSAFNEPNTFHWNFACVLISFPQIIRARFFFCGNSWKKINLATIYHNQGCLYKG